MSLTSFVKMPEVILKIKPLRRNFDRKINSQIRIEPRTNNYSIVGTAFDYLLRFEIKRKYKYAVMEPWIAEVALEVRNHNKKKEDDMGPVYHNMFPEIMNKKSYMEEATDEFIKVVGESKEVVNKYINSENPSIEEQIILAGYAIRLAKIDIYFRSGYLDPAIQEANPNDIKDLIELLSIVPFDEIIKNEPVILNPRFGESSLLVDGADADLISGDLLIDFKTTRNCLIKEFYFDQLLGYYLLARYQKQIDPNYPYINRLGLYFCRHGYLWIFDANKWINNPQFFEIEEWFMRKAKEVFLYKQIPDDKKKSSRPTMR